MGGRRSRAWTIGVAIASTLVGAFVVVRLHKARAIAHAAPMASSAAGVVLDAAVLEMQAEPADLIPLEQETADAAREAPLPVPVATSTSTGARPATAVMLTAETPKPPAQAKTAEEGTTPPHDNTPVTRRIDVSHTLGLHTRHLADAEVTREIARIRPALDACYVAPECARSSSAECIDSVGEKRLTFTARVDTTGRVHDMRHSGGIRLWNCVDAALRTTRFSPYTRRPLEEYDDFTLVIQIR